MKKKITLGVGLIIVILLIVSVGLLTHGVGTKKYYSELLNSNIEIPRYAYGMVETTGEDTYQLEFSMFGKEEHIIKQLREVFETNEINGNISDYQFRQWSVNDEKTHKLVVIVYEK